MRASDIKVGCIYNIIFDPVRDCEFNGKHLAVVLKKNNDKSTFIVMPLTSNSNGNGINKIHIGQILSLPASLQNNHTYAVYNQVRTVNASRFISLKEGNTVIEATLSQDTFQNLLLLAIRELIYSLNQDMKIKLLRTAHEQECAIKVKDIAYRIIALKKLPGTSKEISELENQIREIQFDAPSSLKQNCLDENVKRVLEQILDL